MADNVSVPSGSGAINVIIGADEVTDGTLGTVKIQYMKLMDGTLDGTVKSTIKAASTAPVATDPALVVALSPNAPAKISDGTNTAAVKAGSTSPVATDPALVVTMSPKAARPADLTNSGTISGATGFTLACTGATVGSWSIPGGNNFVGTIRVQASFDGGNNYYDIPVVVASTGNQQIAVSLASAAVSAGFGIPAGATHISLTCSAYTSGTGTFTLNAGNTGDNTFLRLTDGTNDATIKAASTAPVAADPALVVSMSPNSTTFVQGVQGARNTGNITTAATVVGPFAANGFNIATVTVSGTYTGVTFVFEGTDDGTNWYGLQGCRTDISIVETGATLLSTTNRAWDVPVGALTQIRIRTTAWASGTAVIGVSFQSMPYEPAPAVGIANIAGIPISASLIAAVGSYGGQYALNTNPNSQQRATYHFTFRPPTNIMTSGSAKQYASIHHTGASTTTTKIRRIFATPISNTISGLFNIELQQFFSGSGGVTATRIGKPDSADPTPQTIGLEGMTQVTSTSSSVAAQAIFLPVLTGSLSQTPILLFDWQECGETKAPMLRKGIQEGWSLAVTTNALTTLGFSVTMILTEE